MVAPSIDAARHWHRYRSPSPTRGEECLGRWRARQSRRHGPLYLCVVGDGALEFVCVARAQFHGDMFQFDFGFIERQQLRIGLGDLCGTQVAYTGDERRKIFLVAVEFLIESTQVEPLDAFRLAFVFRVDFDTVAHQPADQVPGEIQEAGRMAANAGAGRANHGNPAAGIHDDPR